MQNALDYDILIVGGGAAGLSAAIYVVRYNLSTLVVSSDFGGQILETGDIENWPGIKRITGPELSRAFEDHAKELGAKLVQGFVKGIKKVEGGFSVSIDSLELQSVFVKAVVLSAGAKHRRLGIKGEKELSGRGISYCATCDGPFCKDKVIAMVGGGDAALTGAVDLTAHATHVYLIHRRGEFRAKPAYVEAARKNPKIEFIFDTNIIEAKGKNLLEGVVLDKPYKGSNELAIQGLFVEIGFLPETSLVKDLGVEFDEQGYIKVGADQSTSVPGVFAAGDVKNASNRFAQLVTAASEGAIAAEGAFRYIQNVNR